MPTNEGQVMEWNQLIQKMTESFLSNVNPVDKDFGG